MDYNAPSGSTDANAGYVGKTSSTLGSKVPPKAAEFPQREIVAAEKAAGFVPSNDDTTQLAQSIGRGLWIGALGANANALVGSIGAGANASAPGILKTLSAWTRLRGLALQTNTSVDVTLTVSGIGTAGGVVTAPLRKRDGTTKPAVGDVPTLYPLDVQYDGTVFRFVGAVASDAGGTSKAALVPYETAGTFAWVATSTAIDLTVVGAGGSGGGTNVNTASGAAGAGGGRADKRVTGLVIGQSYTIVVGAGGAAVAANTLTNGATGGTSSAFGVSATGGAGGVYQAGSSATGGSAGGQGSGGDNGRNYQGQGGAPTGYTGTSNYGAGGGAIGFGGGGYPVGGQANGCGPGAGGGGGISTAASGKGADGAVYIQPL